MLSQVVSGRLTSTITPRDSSIDMSFSTVEPARMFLHVHYGFPVTKCGSAVSARSVVQMVYSFPTCYICAITLPLYYIASALWLDLNE